MKLRNIMWLASMLSESSRWCLQLLTQKEFTGGKMAKTFGQPAKENGQELREVTQMDQTQNPTTAKV